jgi:hypothetical protein
MSKVLQHFCETFGTLVALDFYVPRRAESCQTNFFHSIEFLSKHRTKVLQIKPEP